MSAADGPSDARPTIVALAALTVALTAVAGPVGTVAGLATAVTWYALGTPYAIAAGHVVLVAAFEAEIDPLSFLIAELAFVALLVAPAVRTAAPVGHAVVAVTGAAGLVGAGWFVGRSQPLWIAAGTVLTLFALAAYTLHRYELVRLGLVPDDRSTDPRPSDT